MRWEGERCYGMGVGLVQGTARGKAGTRKRLLPTNHRWNHCGALLASAGQLGTPLGAAVSVFYITWGVLVPFRPQLPKDATIESKREPKWWPQGVYFEFICWIMTNDDNVVFSLVFSLFVG